MKLLIGWNKIKYMEVVFKNLRFTLVWFLFSYNKTKHGKLDPQNLSFKTSNLTVPLE